MSLLEDRFDKLIVGIGFRQHNETSLDELYKLHLKLTPGDFIRLFESSGLTYRNFIGQLKSKKLRKIVRVWMSSDSPPEDLDMSLTDEDEADQVFRIFQLSIALGLRSDEIIGLHEQEEFKSIIPILVARCAESLENIPNLTRWDHIYITEPRRLFIDIGSRKLFTPWAAILIKLICDSVPMNQKNIAKKAGINESTITDMKQGRFRFRANNVNIVRVRLERFCDAVNIDIDIFFYPFDKPDKVLELYYSDESSWRKRAMSFVFSARTLFRVLKR